MRFPGWREASLYSRRRHPGVFLIIEWARLVCRCISLPVPVWWNRFTADLCDFIFGMGFIPLTHENTYVLPNEGCYHKGGSNAHPYVG